MLYHLDVLLPYKTVQHGLTALPILSGDGWLAVLFLGTIAGAVQYSLFIWALRWLPPTTTVLYLTLNPITAMVLGILLLGEKVRPELIVGLVLVLTGILVGNKRWPLSSSRQHPGDRRTRDVYR